MNIIKIQDQLKNVPDRTLVGYVQNPVGQVPTYLALAELQRRKEMRANYQATKPEEKTVAEDLVQESQPGIAALPEGQPMQQAMQPPPEMPVEQMAQGGLADLDTGDMYDENSYANGGIVAFDDGGEVKHFATGNYVVPFRTPQQYYDAIKGNKDLRKPFWFDQFATPYDEAIKFYQEEKSAATDPEKQRQLDNAIAELNMQKYKFARSKEDPTEMMTQTGMKGIASDGKPVPKPIDIADIDRRKTGNLTPPNPIKEVKEKATGQKDDVVMAPDIDVKGDPFYFEERPEDVAEAERKRYKDMYGTDPFIKRGEDRLSAMDKRAKSMEEKAPWFALAQAGFEMASAKPEYGKGQSTAADIARAGVTGIKSYAETQKQLADLDEKRFNIDAKIADAQRAVELAAMQHGFKSEEYNKAANDLKRTELLKGQLDIKKYETLAGTNETKMVMAQKQNFLKSRDQYLKDNWRIKNAIDVFNDANAFNRLPEAQKKAIMQDVNTYNLYIQNLKLSYPLANMDLPTRDPLALLNKVRT